MSRPKVVLAVKVRPANARYDLLDLAVNGALVKPVGPYTGDLIVTVDEELITRETLIQARAKSVRGPIAFSVLAWSSHLVDDPTTEVDERWKIIGSKAGADVLEIENTFVPVAVGGQS